AAPTGWAALSGTPSDSTQATQIAWTTAQIDIPTAVRPGETWTVTLTDAVSSTDLVKFTVVGTSDAASDVASHLAGAINGHGGYTATTPTGSRVDEISATALNARVVTIETPAGSSDSYSLSLDGGTPYVQSGASAAAIAQAFRDAINLDGGYAATSSGGTLTILKLTAGSF